MSSKRPAILMGVLLLALAGYFIGQHADLTARAPGSNPVDPPLPGKNAIANLKVSQDAMGTWTAEFDYFYSGEPQSAMALTEAKNILASLLRQNPRFVGAYRESRAW